jgi:ABC-type glycerol-3-phosphate transport system permease component
MSTSQTLRASTVPARKGRSGLQKIRRAITLYFTVILFILIVLLPFYWIAKSAVSTRDQLFTIPPTYLPSPMTLENFRTLATQVPLFFYVRNSIIYAVLTTAVTLILSFMAAYGFARIKVPGSQFLLWALVLSVALPEIATVIPLYQTLNNLSLIDTVTGLIIVMSGTLLPFTIWMFVAFIQQVPYEIEEAAIIDGASLPQVILYILVPVSAPALATMAVINFINTWNNLLYPLAFSATVQSKTLSVAITEIFQAREPWGRPWNLVSALGLTMVIPVIILIIFSQKAIVRGLTRGAGK